LALLVYVRFLGTFSFHSLLYPFATTLAAIPAKPAIIPSPHFFLLAMGGLRTRSFFALILALPTLARQTAHARRQVARTAPALISTTHGIVVGRADATPYPTSTRDEDIGNFDVSDCHLHGTDV